MDDLIKRQDALNALLMNDTFQAAHDALEHLPAVEVEHCLDFSGDYDGLICATQDSGVILISGRLTKRKEG